MPGFQFKQTFTKSSRNVATRRIGMNTGKMAAKTAPMYAPISTKIGMIQGPSSVPLQSKEKISMSKKNSGQIRLAALVRRDLSHRPLPVHEVIDLAQKHNRPQQSKLGVKPIKIENRVRTVGSISMSSKRQRQGYGTFLKGTTYNKPFEQVQVNKAHLGSLNSSIQKDGDSSTMNYDGYKPAVAVIKTKAGPIFKGRVQTHGNLNDMQMFTETGTTGQFEDNFHWRS